MGGGPCPDHPGESLLEGFMAPLGLSQNRLALDLGVPASRINCIIQAKRAITADTALRLGRYFQVSRPEMWLGFQSRYDLEIAKRDLGAEIDRVRVLTAMPSKAIVD